MSSATTSMARTALYAATAFAVILGSAALAYGTMRGSRDRAAVNDATAKELASLRQELNSLKFGQQALAVQRAALLAAAAPAAGVAAAAPGIRGEPQPPAEKPFTEEEMTRKNKEVASNLGARFDAEPVDAGWRLEKVRAIRDALASAAGSNHVDQADCASTLCKVVITHPNPRAQQEFASGIVNLDPFKAGLFFDYEDDPPRTTVYVIREGHTFADVAP